MAFSELAAAALERPVTGSCEAKVPTHVRDRVVLHLMLEGHTVTLLEKRPHLLERER